MEHRYKIEIVNNNEMFAGLRTLWCEVFDDDPRFVDAMYANFGDDITGYVAIDDEGRVGSALTCFLCGEFAGKPVYVSYAICTAEELRGLGLAGQLVERARDDVLAKGGLSLISPAEPSLENFYGPHGYVPFFYVEKKLAGSEGDSENGEPDEDFIFDEEDAGYDKVQPTLSTEALDASTYNEWRERFLAEIPHVAMNEHMMRLVQAESTLPDGSGGLLLINGGDAICALSAADSNKSTAKRTTAEEGSLTGKTHIEIEELIINPALSAMSGEIESEIAIAIAKQFGQGSLRYKTPGDGSCQSMLAGAGDTSLDDNANTYPDSGIRPYFGFPIE